MKLVTFDDGKVGMVEGDEVVELDVPSMREYFERNHMPFPVIADPERRVGTALGLPTFETHGLTLYKRLALVAEQARIVKVFYPVFPPDRNAEEVVAWLVS